jgi:hypothetical protein
MVVSSLGLSARAQTPIINGNNFVSGGSNVALDGTQVGLTSNLPGGNWTWGAGWNWQAPEVLATWNGGSPMNCVFLGEEKTVLGIPLTTGTYTPPTQLQVSALISPYADGSHTTGGGLGFWSVLPARDDSLTSQTNFTGLQLDSNGDVQLYQNGIASGSPITTGLAAAAGAFYPLSFNINTATGSISNIMYDGAPVSGITSSAFTAAATANFGVCSWGSGRCNFNDIEVAAATPEPASLALLALGGLLVLPRRRRV